jgi:nucleotide-binding universal stress UspA family protein
MYDRILIPTDGSEPAVRAGEHARYLARLFGATVHVVSVVDVEGAAGPFDAGGVDQAFVDRLETSAERSIEAIEATVEGSVAVQTAILDGEPADAILEYAAAEDIDVVAMGTHGRTGLRRYIAGSVTERVLRLSEVPVLTVRAIEESRVGAYDEILVPTDGSEQAEAAVDHALEIAGATGARIHAVYVVHVGAITVGPDYTPPEELIDRLEADGRAAAEAVAARAETRDVEAVTAVERGFPADDLLAYAADEGIDLVTMGTHGRRGLDRYLLGSTTEQIVRHADVPVLAVPTRDTTAE